MGLLSAPESVQQQILSWRPDSATANALLNSCSTLHLLRRDPMAAALLLMHCQCQDYEAALASCTACQGSSSAVSQQVLQLLRPEAGGRGHTAAPPLLHAMLCASSAAREVELVRTLLALPQPPDVDASDGRALRAAVENGPQMQTLQALLEGGADPLAGGLRVIAAAAESSQRRPALRMLMRACTHLPELDRWDVLMVATASALHHNNAALLASPLWPGDGPVTREALFGDAACRGTLVRLRLYLDLQYPPSESQMDHCLGQAACRGRAAVVELLLTRGAVASHGSSRALLFAMVAPAGCPVNEEDRQDVVHVLCSHGAVVEDALALAEEVGRADLAALLLGIVWGA